jgi:hypothetical protein
VLEEHYLVRDADEMLAAAEADESGDDWAVQRGWLSDCSN